MKSIKYKILLSFCITASAIIMGLGILISSRLSASIERQSKMLSDDLIAMTSETLVGYHSVFELKVNDIMKEIERILMEISHHTGLLENIENLQIDMLTAALNGFRAHSDEMDFVLLFDLKGHHLASSPSPLCQYR